MVTYVNKVRFLMLLGLVLPGTVIAANLKTDHATVCGEHLDSMRAALTSAAGVPTEYGGPHSNHATEMALVSFPDGSYLELMGIQKNADPAAVAKHEWSKFLRSNAGPCAFAVHVTDIAAEVRELKSAGVAAGEPETAGRMRPDGIRLLWQTASVGPKPRGSLFPFLIADQTARELRAYPSGKPTTEKYGGIAQVVIGVSDLNRAVDGYMKAFGLPQPIRQRDARFGERAWFEGTPIVLTQGKGQSDAPVAFLLANGKAAIAGSGANWFGHTVVWMDEAKLGWRLGVLI